MNNLKSFKKEKVELKNVNGGGGCPKSGWFLWAMPGGASTPGNTQAWAHAD